MSRARSTMPRITVRSALMRGKRPAPLSEADFGVPFLTRPLTPAAGARDPDAKAFHHLLARHCAIDAGNDTVP